MQLAYAGAVAEAGKPEAPEGDGDS
jgi:hypothetical protein